MKFGEVTCQETCDFGTDSDPVCFCLFKSFFEHVTIILFIQNGKKKKTLAQVS